MSRLSREQKRESKRQRSAVGPGAGPVEVWVPAPAGESGGGATVGGVPVVVVPGETVQACVLNHLHRLALAAGHSVRATIHDERIGFVVPLEVYGDGSSRYTGEPVRLGPSAEVPGLPATPPAMPAAPPAPPRVPVSEPQPLPGAAPTHVLRALPEPTRDAAPGVAVAPTGEFGPPPPVGPTPERPAPAMEAMSVLDPEPEPDPKPTPARGFDAVAESVLAPVQETEGAAFLVEPVARINEAVKMGRIEEATGMAERVGADASRSLGPEHPEVLRLRELTSYIAYLAGDPLRAFHVSLDLARVRRRHQDPEAAYGNVQSAAAAWRAVRDPVQGLNLGQDLITLWTELVADGGPAADDLEQLESARTRMTRLTDRARARSLADNPYTP
ncbi:MULTISPECIES: tetratricopeptide repeat protein [Streptomyces]|uniref:Tetratricopeptide repeat protein n=1 Tax=Streptomyces mirabilis TaxID=68239 RepID=A0ABU3UN14_9ACTN|nr:MULTISPECIES: tetratricopeptide repeat protein [Streptomyces]MDU8995317.1 tetratricopeptide repeat protein [Streptomyces mirabilis]QDN89459.1 tetratricopeptide repeat protein [Streptomyces sp. RLB3-6]QDO10306.1 tetratricopeptide repeat protein [Streptomyces sp. S1D4-23]